MSLYESLSKEDYQEHPKVEMARAFAMQVHGQQQYGHSPYVYHLDQVAYYAKDYGETAVVIAYLHDVLEDTDADPLYIEHYFGLEVLRCVQLLTDPAGDTRAQRKDALNKQLAQADETLHLALIVKAADRLANVRFCIKNASIFSSG